MEISGPVKAHKNELFDREGKLCTLVSPTTQDIAEELAEIIADALNSKGGDKS